MTTTALKRIGLALGALAVMALFAASGGHAEKSGPLPLFGEEQSRRVPASREELRLSFAPVVKRAAPAVVNVYSRRVVRQPGLSPFFDDPIFRRFFGERGFGIPRRRVQRSLGSGVIVRPTGVIVTNNHVIRGGTDIQVVLNDGREFAAEVVLTDEKTDLAVLKIDADGESLSWLAFHDSDDLEVGDLVLAIGNPFGVGQTVTSGIVSALARTQKGISDFQFFIQTDAAINPGNSGGALVNLDGELVGINTAIFSRSGGSNGIGFAIPSNMVRVVVDSSRVGGRVRRPWLGAGLQDVTPAIADSLGLDRPRGALVKSVHPRGPAADAGLRPGDVVLRIDEYEVKKPQELNYRLATRGVGGTADLLVYRGGRKRHLELELMLPPEDPPRNETVLEGRHPFSGALVANLSPALAEELRLDNATEGVVILRAGRGRAARNGFRRGDIIVEVEGRRIRRVADLVRITSRPRRVWRFSVRRGDKVGNFRARG